MSWEPSACEKLARSRLTQAGRWQHVQLVAGRAAELRAEVVVVSAAWLHDVGYAISLRRTGMHAVDGAVYLRSLDAPPQLVSLVAYHTGAEYEADERGLAEEMAAFERPNQDLLDTLTFADLSVGPTGERVSPSARLDDVLERYPVDHPVHRAVSRSRGYLEGCVARALARLPHPM